jgi:hypothetical protein
MAQQEVLEFVIDPKQSLKAITDINTGLDSFEKKGTQANDRYQASLAKMGEALGKTYDRFEKQTESYIRSLEKQAAAAGKTGIDKLDAQMQQALKTYGSTPQAIDRITQAYERLKQAQDKVKGGEGGGLNFREIGEGLKGAIEQPAQAAQTAVVGLLEKLGPLGVAFGATVGVAITAGAAIYELTNKFAEFGIEARDVQLRTGLSAEQLGKFTFAAKAAGTDISIVERLMRGLTTAIEDDSTKGEKAREVLRGMGVDLQGVKDGTVSVAEVLQTISRSWEENHDTLLRNKEAMDLFKKAGIDAVPFLTELNENLEKAEHAGLGYSQQVIDAGVTTQKELALMGMHWDQLKLKIEGAAASIYGAITGFSKYDELFKKYEEWQEKQKGGESGDLPTIKSLAGHDWGISVTDSRQAQKDADMGTQAGLRYQLGQAQKAENDALKTLVSTSPTSEKWEDVHNKYVQAEADVKKYTDAIKAMEDAQKQAEKIAKLKPFVGPIYGPEIAAEHQLDAFAQQMARPKLGHPENNLEDVKDWFTQYKEQQKMQEDAQKATVQFEEQIIKLQTGEGGELDAAKKIYDFRMKTAESVLDQYKAGLDYMRQVDEAQEKADQKHQEALDKQEKEQKEQLEKLNEAVAKTTAGLYETLFTHPQDFGKKLRSTLQTKATTSAADYLGHMTANLLVPGGAKTKDPIESTDINTQATLQNTQAVLQNTAHLAGVLGVQAPTVGGFGSLPSISINAPTPSGGGGTTNYGWSTGGGAPAGGGSSSGGPSFISIPSFGSLSSPDIMSSLPGGPGGTSGFAGPVHLGGGGGSTAAGVALPLAALMLGGGGKGGGSSSPLSMILGGGGKSGGAGSPAGFMGLFGKNGFNMSSLFSRAKSPFASADNPDGSFLGMSSQGVGGLAGAGLGMVGTSLLSRSLFGGQDVGTGKGILEGAGGGAALGMQYAGPLGAAVGAVAGALAGVGEMLAGMESPQDKAKRLVKTTYQITISTGMANQIVAIAQQKYGNNVQEAVRSPEVRQMLGLYAAGTGQKSSALLTEMTPHAGNLIMQGGQLQQEASYMYGQAYTYQSSLPTYGGVSSTTLPSPSNTTPVHMQLNINGSDNLTNFMAGNVITPGMVQSQFATAQQNSTGRVQNAATVQQPGLIAS